MKLKGPILLNRLELQIMKIIWKKEQATARQVKKELDKKRPLAYSTVATMLKYLEQKGFLTHDVGNRAYVYKPLVQEEEVSKGMLQDLIDRLFDGEPELLMNTLAKVKDLKKEEVQQLRDRITQHYKEKADG